MAKSRIENRSRMHVALLVDQETLLPSASTVLCPRNGKVERHVAATLRSLGHSVSVVALDTSLAGTLRELAARGPHIVFNLTEHYQGSRERDFFVAQMLEQSGLAFTGTSSDGLAVCRDKSASKYLAGAADVAVPVHAVWAPGRDAELAGLPYPCVVKPLRGDGGELIAQASLVSDCEQARRRAEYVWHRTKQPAIVEEYIHGDEYSVTVTAEDARLVRVWSITRLEIPSTARVALVTSAVKHDDAFRRRHRICYRSATPLEPVVHANLLAAAEATTQALGIDGYARLEFRVRAGRAWLIEANPNHNLNRFSQSTPYRSFGHDLFIAEVLRLGMARHGRLRPVTRAAALSPKTAT